MLKNVMLLTFSQVQVAIDSWLSPADPSTNYNAAIQRRHKDSGRWFLQSASFEKWKRQRNSFLWLRGIPGCGKTVLSSIIIEHLKESETIIDRHLLYFYFDDNDVGKQSLEKMLRVLTSQLYTLRGEVSEQLHSLFSLCNNGKDQPALGSLRSTFVSMAEKAGEIWLVLDAVDESSRDTKTRKQLLSWIQDTVTSSRHLNIHLLITSRIEEDIESELKNCTIKPQIVSIHSDLIGNDIQEFIEHRVAETTEFKRWGPKGRERIKKVLSEKANGMFKWVDCQLDALEKCLGPTNLDKALEDLPENLEETYSRILNNIPDNYKNEAIRILQFLTYSPRPLTIDELVDALAVNTNNTVYFNPHHRIPIKMEMLRYCPGLVAVAATSKDSKSKGVSDGDEDGDDVVRIELAHSSIREYIISKRFQPADQIIKQDLQEANAKASMAKVCFGYLLSSGSSALSGDFRNRTLTILHDFPLTTFCDEYCPSLAAVLEADDTVQDFVRKFLHEIRWSNSLYLLPKETQYDLNFHHYSALCYASRSGLKKGVQYLLGQNVYMDPEILKAECNKALWLAADQGYYEIAELLLNSGADPNHEVVYSIRMDRVLTRASGGGHRDNVGSPLASGRVLPKSGCDTGVLSGSPKNHLKFVELLLGIRAPANAQGEIFGNPRYMELPRGWVNTVGAFPNKANVNADSDSALLRASLNGHRDIVKLLLENGADVNTSGPEIYSWSLINNREDLILLLAHDNQYEDHGNAILGASSNGNRDVVELLLEYGANINKDGGKALCGAAQNGHRDVVELLLKNGANINWYYGKALYRALVNGHRDIVKLFLEVGADVNLDDGNFLYRASEYGYQDVVELLLEGGAGINARNKSAALRGASWGGHRNIVELWLKNGADVNASGEKGALYAASLRGYQDVVELLLEGGAGINARNKSAALSAASWGGHRNIVELWLKNGADVNASGEKGALYGASLHGYQDVVELLLEGGAGINARNKSAALSAASAHGHRDIVELLLKNGADIDINAGESAALRWASWAGHRDVVELLLEYGADVDAGSDGVLFASLVGHHGNIKIGRGGACAMAVRNGHCEVLELLLNRGVDLNVVDYELFSVAAYLGYYDVVKLLLERGVSRHWTLTKPAREIMTVETWYQYQHDGPLTPVAEPFSSTDRRKDRVRIVELLRNFWYQKG
ncbi:hypothetical protein TWF730_001704 [Orbilia blumenaviensis]|uniref:NACHT domain-containing protein n=1 Tax=Orbilia blumenaviensis TaxID=1796055 RepID=A0AAV9UJ97_9PEZI